MILKNEKLHQHKEPISIKNVEKNYLNILLVTNMLKNIPVCMFLPKMTAYRKDCDETNYISFLIKDNELLEK